MAENSYATQKEPRDADSRGNDRVFQTWHGSVDKEFDACSEGNDQATACYELDNTVCDLAGISCCDNRIQGTMSKLSDVPLFPKVCEFRHRYERRRLV